MRELIAVLIALYAGQVAPGPDPGNDPVALAETLFQDGKRLLEQGDARAACPKLAESLRLDRATGTLLALAMCHEVEGRLASAWAEYLEVVARAKKDGRADREEAARQYAHALEARLSTLSIAVPAAVAQIPGLAVQRDGLALEAPAWSTAVPVDPGRHVVVAAAPGRRGWTTSVTVNGPADHQTVTVPLLPPEDRRGALLAAPPDAELEEASAPARVSPAAGVLATVAVVGAVATADTSPALAVEIAVAHHAGWGGAVRGAWLTSEPAAAIDGGGEVALRSFVLRGWAFHSFRPDRVFSIQIGPELLLQLDRAEPSGLQGAQPAWRAGWGVGVGAGVDIPLARWVALSMLASADYAPAAWAGSLDVTNRGEVLRPGALRVLVGAGPRFALDW